MHAHPDDESINNGATMARYAAEGAQVTLVTCTLGEEGEVIPPELAHLAADRDDAPRRRTAIGELAAAMKELGVTDHRFLGGPGRFRDSGMMGAEQNDRAGCLLAARTSTRPPPYLVEVIREVRPQVLVTYDPDGGYGHPDHIQAHRVAMRAAELAADPAYRPDLGAPHAIAQDLLEPGAPLGRRGGLRPAARGRARLPGRRRRRRRPRRGRRRARSPPRSTARRTLPRKTAAMRAHATQIAVDGPFFALSNELAQPLFTTSTTSWCGAPGERRRRETDLFAGVPDGPSAPRRMRRVDVSGADRRAAPRPAALAAAQAGSSGACGGTGLAAPPWTPRGVAAYLGCSSWESWRLAGALVQGGWFPGGLLLALVGAGGLFYGGARRHRDQRRGGGARRRLADRRHPAHRRPPGGGLHLRRGSRLVPLPARRHGSSL